MTSHRFSTGTQFSWRGFTFEVLRYLPDKSSVSVENLDTGSHESFPLQSLVDSLFSDELQFVTKTRHNNKRATCSKPLPEELTIDLSDYVQHLVETAKFRLSVIQPLILLKPAERSQALVQARVDEVKTEHPNKKVSVRSIYRWLKDWELSGGNVRALIPNYAQCGGKGKSRLDQSLKNIIDQVIKDNKRRENVTIDEVYALVATRIQEENRLLCATEKLAMPARATIARRMDELDLSNCFEWKRGKRAARKESRQVKKMDQPELPIERVEFDHTKTDLIVVDENDNLPLGRLTLSYLLDVATRYPLGYYLGFEPPSYYTVLETLYHAITPKPDVEKLYGTEHQWTAYGIPNMMVVDNGKELIGRDLTDACELLGIVLNIAPVKTPEFKGTVERNFRTFNTGLFHKLPGTTFSNFIQRGDYKSSELATISLNDLEKALNIYIVDIYSEKKHDGLNGIPARRWEYALQTNFFPRLPQDRNSLRILLGRVDYRTIQRYGIDFNRIRYNSDDLALLRMKKAGERVKIKYHPGDLSRIYVFDEYEKRYIETPALDQEYTQNLSLWKHRVILNYARQVDDDMDLAGLGRAMRKIQEIVDAARDRAKTTKKRAKIARWDNSGSPPSLADKTISKQSTVGLLPTEDNSSESIDNNREDASIEISIPEGSEGADGWSISNALPR